MTNKHFYRAIVLRLVIIIVLTAAAVWFWFKKDVVVSVVLILLLFAAIINIIRYFNNINRWISFFLLGIENEDASLKVPSKTGNKAIDDVYVGMKRLNELFRLTKIEISTQEQYFRSIINQSGTGLFSVNQNGRIININPAAIKLTGLNEYHHINTISKIDDSLPEFIMLNKSNRNQQSAIYENQYGQKLLFKLSEINISGKAIKLIAVSDITKELDSREVDAWIKLARTLSHEIMNNIAPVTTLSQVIAGYFTKNDTPVTPDDIDGRTINNTIKGLTVIEERSSGLMSFVENYRKFTKLPEPQISEINLIPLIENNLIAAAAFPEFNTIKLHTSMPEKLLVFTDEKLLSQVITNLLKNATEALSTNEADNRMLSIEVQQNNGLVKIDIKNNGPSISAKLSEQIFIPFFTTKEEGSGIGLSLSKQIMLSMGGDIVMMPEKSNLTIFTITMG
jgi:PAS domain S-box-containing protein